MSTTDSSSCGPTGSSRRTYSTRELQAAATALTAGQFSIGPATLTEAGVESRTAAGTGMGPGARIGVPRWTSQQEPIWFPSTKLDRSDSGPDVNSDPVADRIEPDPPGPFGGSALVRVRATNSGAGASTVALCIADAADSAGVRTRILDAATPAWSGLVGATSTELGAAAGWRRGRRGNNVVIDRLEEAVRGPASVPVPRECQAIDLSVLDVGWSMRETSALTNRGGWLATAPARVEVLVTRPHWLALSQTEAALCDLEEHLRGSRAGITETTGDTNTAASGVAVVVVGASRWNERGFSAAGPQLRDAQQRGAVLYAPLLPPTIHPGQGHPQIPRQLLALSRRLLKQITTITGPLTATRS